MSFSVYLSTKDHFLTPRSVDKFKKDLKSDKELVPSKYLKEGFNFEIKKTSNDRVDVNIISQEEYDKNKRKQELRMKLKNARYGRSTQPKKKLDSLKRSIPDNIYKAYLNIIRKYQFNIPAPDEVINNLEKYRLQVSLLMDTNQRISNDANANNLVKKYFKLLGEFLGIEPMSIPTQLPENNKVVNNELSKDNETETEDEDEAPELVSA
jgi:hypothetical protein|tara:strand:- start:537 stop:1163 length:627 start_codon:yes stop_codon:yes gene_type:complete